MLDRLLGRPVSVTMVLLVLIVLGIVGIGRLPVSLIPDVDIPYVTVQVTSPDMSARELEDAVVRPLRQSLVQTAHLSSMRSEAKDGSAVISLTFEEGQDVDYYYIEVNEKVDRAMSSLPRISRPKVFKASATDIPAFYINMTLGDASAATRAEDKVLYPVSDEFRQMSDFARDVIAKRLEQLPEVALVDVSGTVESEILVIPDQDKLRGLGMTVGNFESTLASANVTLSNLTIRDGEYHYNVKFQSFVSSQEDIGDVYFSAGDKVLQIKDVAEVITHPAPRSGMDVSDGDDAVVLAVIKQSEARMSDLRKAISGQLDAFSEDYPQIRFTVTRDQTELLDYSIRNLLLNIIIAILLDCVVIFFFMKDFRTPLLASLTIPVSLVISFFIFYLIGLSINIISLSGLLLGVGMMVDNTIVLTDNITARWQRGESLRTSVVEGTREVSGPMLSSVLTTCAVFIPLVFLNGLSGELFFDQAVSVTVVLLTSYLVTIIAVPVYYWALYRRHDAFKPSKFLSRIRIPGAMKLYDRGVNWFLSHLWTVWAIPVACLAVMLLCVWKMPREKLPAMTYTDAIVNVDWNEHITLDENRSRIDALTASACDGCVQITAMVGVQQFVLEHSGDQSMSQASVYVSCADADALARVKDEISAYMRARYPEAICSFSSSGNIFETVFAEKEPRLQARLRPAGSSGMDVDKLQAAVESIREALPGVHIDEIPLKTDVIYISDPEKMALYGVSFSDLTRVLTNSLNGNTVFEIVQGNRSVPVVMGTDVREMEDILSESFIHLVSRDTGEPYDIPVSAVMRQSWENDLKTLISGDEGSYYPVSMDIKASEVPAAMARIKQVIREDRNFEVGFTGSYFSNKEMVRQMLLVLLVAVVLLFLILAAQFESLVQPVIILSEIVIDIALSLLACWALGVSVNLMSLIGLIVICGIVINDSILKIDTINRLVRAGMPMESAIHEAGHRRLKAIIMTSITTVFAVAPFLSRGSMGDDLQYPMALVIVVGMTIGTLVSLFYVPALYDAIYRRKG